MHYVIFSYLYRGCSRDRLISDFTYDRSTGSAEATLYSMFRLPHSNKTYFQCDVAICRGMHGLLCYLDVRFIRGHYGQLLKFWNANVSKISNFWEKEAKTELSLKLLYFFEFESPH